MQEKKTVAMRRFFVNLLENGEKVNYCGNQNVKLKALHYRFRSDLKQNNFSRNTFGVFSFTVLGY